MEWHDFRKEKPINNRDYLLKVRFPVFPITKTKFFYKVRYWYGEWQKFQKTDNEDVVAWAELPKCDIT